MVVGLNFTTFLKSTLDLQQSFDKRRFYQNVNNKNTQALILTENQQQISICINKLGTKHSNQSIAQLAANNTKNNFHIALYNT